MKTIAMTTTSFGNLNSPQKDLAIDALSSTLATPKSAVKKKKTASDSTSFLWSVSLANFYAAVSVCLLTKFHPPLAVEEHVLWFEVSVDDPLLVTAIHRLTYLI